MRFLTKWAALALPVLLLAAWSAAPATAGEKLKLVGKRIAVITHSTVEQVGDAQGHVMGVNTSEGVDLLAKMTFKTVATFDGTMGKGATYQGYGQNLFPDGDKSFTWFEGKVMPKPGPGGQPMVLTKGTWKFTGGTGKWAGVQGGGTFKGRYLSQTILTYDLEGEYTLKSK